jgi:hypothetical protein
VPDLRYMCDMRCGLGTGGAVGAVGAGVPEGWWGAGLLGYAGLRGWARG